MNCRTEESFDLKSVTIDLKGDFVRERLQDSQAFRFNAKNKSYRSIEDIEKDIPSLADEIFQASKPDFEAWLKKLQDTARAYYYLKAN